jgi:hypothetical protein
MLTGLALAALILFVATQGKHGGAEMDASTKADLSKLQSANPTSYTAIMAALAEKNPVRLIQYAASLLASYPALATTMGNLAASLVIPVTGKSGTAWNTWGTHDKAGDLSTVYVLLGGMPVVWYSQAGSDTSSRKFLGAQPGVDSATLARARADFGV